MNLLEAILAGKERKRSAGLHADPLGVGDEAAAKRVYERLYGEDFSIDVAELKAVSEQMGATTGDMVRMGVPAHAAGVATWQDGLLAGLILGKELD